MQENNSWCILISQEQQRVKSFRVQSSTAQTRRGLSEILNGEAHRMGSSAFPWRWRRRALLFVFQACTLSKGLLFPLQGTQWKCSLQSVPVPPPISSPCTDFRRTQGEQDRAQHSRELLWGTIGALRSSGCCPGELLQAGMDRRIQIQTVTEPELPAPGSGCKSSSSCSAGALSIPWDRNLLQQIASPPA